MSYRTSEFVKTLIILCCRQAQCPLRLSTCRKSPGKRWIRAAAVPWGSTSLTCVETHSMEMARLDVLIVLLAIERIRFRLLQIANTSKWHCRLRNWCWERELKSSKSVWVTFTVLCLFSHLRASNWRLASASLRLQSFRFFYKGPKGTVSERIWSHHHLGPPVQADQYFFRLP